MSFCFRGSASHCLHSHRVLQRNENMCAAKELAEPRPVCWAGQSTFTSHSSGQCLHTVAFKLHIRVYQLLDVACGTQPSASYSFHSVAVVHMPECAPDKNTHAFTMEACVLPVKQYIDSTQPSTSWHHRINSNTAHWTLSTCNGCTSQL